MAYITIDDRYLKDFTTDAEIDEWQAYVTKAHNELHNKTGLGSDYLGWLEYPNLIPNDEIERIKAVAEQIKQHSELFLVIGVGGSYLGARAADRAAFPYIFERAFERKKERAENRLRRPSLERDVFA